MALKGSRGRGLTASLLGLSTWAVTVWLASRIVAVPPGSLVFWLVLLAVMLVFGFLPLSGFHGDSLKVAIAVGIGSWIALGPMATPFWPFLLGCFVVGVGLVLGVAAAGSQFMDAARGEGEPTQDDWP